MALKVLAHALCAVHVAVDVTVGEAFVAAAEISKLPASICFPFPFEAG